MIIKKSSYQNTSGLTIPLAMGDEVHIISSSLRNDMKYTYFKNNHINGATYSTQLGMKMLNQYDLPLRHITLVGEKLKPTRPSSVRVINGYGPTEFTYSSSLSQTLTDYMVPTAFIRMEAMPLTNRKALPVPEVKAEEIVEPATGKEELLLDIVKILFSRDDLGVSTDLIRMGLTSLSAIKLVAMVNKKGLKLKVNDIFKHKTIRKILSQKMSLIFRANDYHKDKPIVVVIHGLSNYLQLNPLTIKLTETYSVFVIEPLEMLRSSRHCVKSS